MAASAQFFKTITKWELASSPQPWWTVLINYNMVIWVHRIDLLLPISCVWVMYWQTGSCSFDIPRRKVWPQIPHRGLKTTWQSLLCSSSLVLCCGGELTFVNYYFMYISQRRNNPGGPGHGLTLPLVSPTVSLICWVCNRSLCCAPLPPSYHCLSESYLQLLPFDPPLVTPSAPHRLTFGAAGLTRSRCKVSSSRGERTSLRKRSGL